MGEAVALQTIRTWTTNSLGRTPNHSIQIEQVVLLKYASSGSIDYVCDEQALAVTVVDRCTATLEKEEPPNWVGPGLLSNDQRQLMRIGTTCS